MVTNARIHVDPDALAAFCRRFKITELALFGSVLRDDFRPDSDVDILVRFAPDAPLGWRHWHEMEQGLMNLFGRSVDLVEWDSVEMSDNPYRRRSILEGAQTLYAA